MGDPLVFQAGFQLRGLATEQRHLGKSGGATGGEEAIIA